MTNNIQYNMPTGTQPWAVKERHRSRGRKVLCLPRYSVGEEIFNGVSHGVGAALSVAALFTLLGKVKNTRETVSVVIFSISMFLLYLVSCLYHSLKVSRAKKVFQVMDHCTIYLLIAGTYTPITLLALPQQKGTILCAVAWAVAAFGIAINSIDMRRFRTVSMVCYLSLGWLIVLFWRDLYFGMPLSALILLLVGGVCYTVGAILFGVGIKIPYMHGAFHLFCIAGSACHFIMICQMLA
jgi:hemolysin III